MYFVAFVNFAVRQTDELGASVRCMRVLRAVGGATAVVATSHNVVHDEVSATADSSTLRYVFRGRYRRCLRRLLAAVLVLPGTHSRAVSQSLVAISYH